MKPTIKLTLTLGLAASSVLFLTTTNAAIPPCYNIGSLGATGNGTHTPNVLVYQPGAVSTGPDYSSYYDGAGAHTTIPFDALLNPPSDSPFTIEFWARPTASDNDDCPVFNRVSAGNRSGWVFFQRDAATGWNWRLYNGNGSEVGWDLTGGSATLESWSHVVGVWDGTTAKLYVNGVDTGAINAGPGGYASSTAANFSVGAYDDGGTASTGNIDEIAFYPTALTDTQIQAHYIAAVAPSPGTYYRSLVLADGAVLYLDQNPLQNWTAYNVGNLGPLADGANTPDVVIDQPGAIAAPIADGNDHASYYNGGAGGTLGSRTTIPFNAALNPPSTSPFTIEFWARPLASDNDDCPVFNRVTDGDRSGWAFFQRDAATGWNWRLYNGNGSQVGWDVTGGTATLDAWSHVVGVWDGSSAKLYVNGVDTGAANTGAGGYNASTSATFSVGAYDNGGTASTGFFDEIAFYPTALNAAQIQAHYDTASSLVPGAYRSLVLSHGAVLYLDQNPPAVSLTKTGATPTVTFTGILSESSDLTAPFWSPSWTDLSTTSPYTLPGPLGDQSFFRSHR
ncbi:MAG TPA: LamG domain-containing protein [Verrucomicrobiae bacterium]|nr:LamG domain-containing protein [Verrucomicrobiae bacterium]